ncbi:MAG: hypothetical protein LBG65_08670 [Puniceicoccales bacterium]|jgi:hypothetical protein|nr:hypothetical protein [Puniceicoccales bacterium]
MPPTNMQAASEGAPRHASLQAPPPPPPNTAPRLPREKITLNGGAEASRNAAIDFKSAQSTASEPQDNIPRPGDAPPLPKAKNEAQAPNPPVRAGTHTAGIPRPPDRLAQNRIPQAPFPAAIPPQIVYIEKGESSSAPKILFFTVFFLVIAAGLFFATNREAVENWLRSPKAEKVRTFLPAKAKPPAKTPAPAPKPTRQPPPPPASPDI